MFFEHAPFLDTRLLGKFAVDKPNIVRNVDTSSSLHWLKSGELAVQISESPTIAMV